ncbi:MAG TPA: SurA N-terminal domain-containing protein [Noviherbaspirillum sp.]|nr:SurA N-terminal domain-containing protein [Noviherbaspirillum sp.]
MFDFIRTHRRLMQFVLLLFIFPSFAFFGLEGYSRYRGDADAVAKVGGQSITRQELDFAQREQMERLREMFGGQFDPRMLDTPEARRSILEGLIVERVLALEAADKRLAVSDQALQQTILEIPGLTGEDGRFDVERYRSLLAARGMTPTSFEARMRRDMVLQQLGDAVQGSAIAPRTVTNRLSDLNDQEREVQELVFRTADFARQVNVTPEMLQRYYEANIRDFEVPARVDAEYIVLTMDALAERINVSEADIKAYYEQNAARFSEPEQRRARHILIRTEPGASEADRAAARKKAEELLVQVRNAPGEFPRFAREHSQDPGSAAQGGDLDFFERGMMVKPFEDAVFSLDKGEISDVVESDFGLHIIQVTDIKPGAVKSLDAVRGELVAEIRRQQATREFANATEQFSDLVFEQADSLQPAAEKLQLQIRKVEGLTRTPNPALGANAPVNHPRFLTAIFSDDAIKNKRNTEAVEVAPGTLIAGRVLNYQPQTRRSLQEVEQVVRERVVREEAEAMARKAGEERLKALREGAQPQGFGAARNVSRVNAQGVAPQAVNAVMRADTTSLPAYVGVELPEQGYAVYRINRVMQPEQPDTARRAAEQQQIANAIAQQEMHAYLESLKRKHKVEVLSVPARAEEQ